MASPLRLGGHHLPHWPRNSYPTIRPVCHSTRVILNSLPTSQCDAIILSPPPACEGQTHQTRLRKTQEHACTVRHSQAHSGTGQMPTPRVYQEHDHMCGTAVADQTRRDASHVITQPMGAYSLYYGHRQGMHVRPTMTSLSGYCPHGRCLIADGQPREARRP